MWITTSKRPGRRSAGSITSRTFVAPTVITGTLGVSRRDASGNHRVCREQLLCDGAVAALGVPLLPGSREPFGGLAGLWGFQNAVAPTSPPSIKPHSSRRSRDSRPMAASATSSSPTAAHGSVCSRPRTASKCSPPAATSTPHPHRPRRPVRCPRDDHLAPTRQSMTSGSAEPGAPIPNIEGIDARISAAKRSAAAARLGTLFGDLHEIDPGPTSSAFHRQSQAGVPRDCKQPESIADPSRFSTRAGREAPFVRLCCVQACGRGCNGRGDAATFQAVVHAHVGGV